jgi:sugar phosphate isomerase/epimerase
MKEDLSKLASLLQPAAEVGADTCYTTVQPASDTLPYHENFEFHRERLAQVSEVLAESNMRLGLTFLASSIHRAGREFQFISSPDALLTLMKTTVVSNLAVVVDLWQWRVGGGTLDQLRELSPEQIVMVRLADIPDDEPMDAIADEKRLMPGTTGIVDNAGALRVLHEIGYQGPVAACPHPKQMKGQTRDRIVQRAADALDNLWKEAELDPVASRLSPVSG